MFNLKPTILTLLALTTSNPSIIQSIKYHTLKTPHITLANIENTILYIILNKINKIPCSFEEVEEKSYKILDFIIIPQSYKINEETMEMIRIEYNTSINRQEKLDSKVKTIITIETFLIGVTINGVNISETPSSIAVVFIMLSATLLALCLYLSLLQIAVGTRPSITGDLEDLGKDFKNLKNQDQKLKLFTNYKEFIIMNDRKNDFSVDLYRANYRTLMLSILFSICSILFKLLKM